MVVLVLAGLLLFELLCQVYARAVVFPRLDALRENPRHYYRPSASPLLAYELDPGRRIEHDAKLLAINRWGIRDLDDDLAHDRWRLAVLGDSVVFGVEHSQERTISALLQDELDPEGREVRVFNLGLGGLNLAELVEYLRVKDAIYDLDEVVYLMNLNDLAPRNSIYEGADNGMYRTYERPWLMSPLFLRKAVYWWVKDGFGGPGWYQWMFDGNADYARTELGRMAEYARQHDIRLSVVLLPSGVSYQPDGYRLAAAHEELSAFLEAEGIPHLDPREAFAADPARDFDATDHPHDAGNLRMAQQMAGFLRGLQSVDRSIRAGGAG